MIEFILNIVLGWVPWWVWAIAALVGAGAIWKWAGWQGLVGFAIGVAAFFGYRQGWNDRGAGKKPAIPVGPLDAPAEKPRQRTIFDMLKRKKHR